MERKPDKARLCVDASWKKILRHCFRDFIAFALPQALNDIDWVKGPRFLDKELLKKLNIQRNQTLLVDTLVEVQLLNGRFAEIYIHVEVQNNKQEEFAKRMARYNTRLSEMYSDRAVVSMAVLLDEDKDWYPNVYERDIFGCRSLFEYPILKLTDYIREPERLEGHRGNIFADVMNYHMLLREAKRADVPLKVVKIELTRHLLKLSYPKEKIYYLFEFLDMLISLNALN